MWNNGTLLPLKGMFVDDSICPVVPGFDAQLDYLLDDKEMCKVVPKGSTRALDYFLDDRDSC